MKKILIISVMLALLVVGYITIAGHYKFELYEAATGFEAGLSELVVKSVDISVGTISYYENQQPSSKPSVLLLHGFGAYKENWLRFARVLKDRFHVLAIDLPGHGKSVHSMNLTYSLSNQVEWVNEFTQKIGLSVFHIAGNSMGGAISAGFASQYPEKVLTVTLINPAGVKDYRAEMQDYLDKGINPLVVKEPSGFSELMDFALEQPPFIPWPITEVSALRAIAFKKVHEKLWLDIKTGLYNNFKARLADIEAPTLVQWGKKDRVISYKNIVEFERLIPNVTTKVWDDVGHAPMIEIPYLSAELMIDHIDSVNE